MRTPLQAALIACALVAGGCGGKVQPVKRDTSKPSGPPAVVSTLALSSGAQAHVINIPLAYGDAVQCVAVAGAAGAVAVSCLPKGIDLPPEE